MYARLVVGMQSQCIVNGGYVHPLTKKSLQDILRTKEADMNAGEELLLQAHSHRVADDDDGDGNWELSFHPEHREEEEEEEDKLYGSIDSPLPCQPLGTNAKSPTVVKTPSSGSLISAAGGDHHQDHLQGREDEDDDDDDEGVFSLEL